MRVRAKFHVSGLTGNAHNDFRQVQISTVYSPDTSTEDHKFWKASPNGRGAFSYDALNPETIVPGLPLDLGAKFYFDVTRIEDGAKGKDALFLARVTESAWNTENPQVSQKTITLNGTAGANHSIEITIDNSAVFDQFVLGASYRFTCTPAE